MAINFSGYLFNDAGAAVADATVKLLQVSDAATEATTTTDSNGYWAFSESDQDRYDVEITSGTSVRRIKWADEISVKEIDVRNSEGNTTPAATFTNITDNTANQVAVFSGANATRADNDEIYMSFKLADSGGNIDEFARMTIVATDVTAGSEDGQIEFDVMKAGTLTKVWTITSSSGAAMSFDMNVDALTIGSGADTDVSLTFDANSADGVITWMEDEDYFKFSDDILMNSTERINFYDTAIYIYSSADGQLDLVADTEIQIAATTIDINGAVALDGAITGATNITLSGELDAATLDISGNADIDGTTNLDAVDIDGAVQIDATLTVGVDDTGYDVKLFGATASAYMLWDASEDDLVLAGAAGIDLAGDIDVDGTANLDAVDIDGAVQIDATFTSGVDGQGYDTKFFGDTSGAYILWDTSADKLLTAGGAVVDIVKDKLLIGGTAVTTTAAELNVLDAVTAGTVTASLGVVVDSNKDIGTFRNITLSGELDAGSLDVSGDADIDGTLEADAITIGGTNVVTGSLITTLGTISAGVWEGTDVAVAHGGTGASSLTDGGILLGSGTSAVTAMAVLADGEMIVGDGTTDPVAESGATLRTSIGVGTGDSPQFTDLTLTDDLILNSDSSVISLGDGNDATLTHDGTTGLTIAANPITIDSAADIVLSAAGGQVTVDDGSTTVLTFDAAEPSLTISDDADTGDNFKISVGAAGITTIATTDDDAGLAHMTIRPDGYLIVQQDSVTIDSTLDNNSLVVKDFDTVTNSAIALSSKGTGTKPSIFFGTGNNTHHMMLSTGARMQASVWTGGGIAPDANNATIMESIATTAAIYRHWYGGHYFYGEGYDAATAENNLTAHDGGDPNEFAPTLLATISPTNGSTGSITGALGILGGIFVGVADLGDYDTFTGDLTKLLDDGTNGSGTATLYIGNNTIDVTAPSDAILKENIEDSSLDSLSLLNQLKLRDFNWKSDHPNYGSNPETQFGMVAQEVEEVLPHLVRQDGDGIRNVQYNNMIPYLVKAIQELNQELQEIKGGS